MIGEFTSQIIKITDTTGTGFSKTISSEVAFDLYCLDNLLGASAGNGIFSSKAFKTTNTDECEFEGCVGNIRNFVDWANVGGSQGMKWGLIVYYFTHPTLNITYLVINYYVDGAQPYYPEPSEVLPTSGLIPFTPLYLVAAAVLFLTVSILRKRSCKPEGI